MHAGFGRFVLFGFWAWLAAGAAGLAAPGAARAESQWSTADASEFLRDGGWILLRTAQFRPAEGIPAAPADLADPALIAAGTRYWIVQLRPPLDRRKRRALEDLGADVLRYIPNHAYLVRADAQAVARMRLNASVAWLGPYRPDYKLSPEIGEATFTDPARPAGEGERLLVLSAFPGEDVDRLAGAATAIGADLLAIQPDPQAPRAIVRVRAGGARTLARIDGIEWIEELGELTLRNNTTRWVAQSNSVGQTPAWVEGLHGEGQVVGHIDGPLDIDSCYLRDSSNNTPGPGHRKVVAYRGTLSVHTHGTHTAATAAGLDEVGGLANAGLAYAAKLSHTRHDLISGFADTASNLYDYLEFANGDDAHVHTNSWGDDTRTSYTWWCVDIDRFSRDFEDDLVLFAVTNTSTLRTPENAKNLLAVGATLQAPNQADHGSGGQGPTTDGRRKPEIYLPGVGIVSASVATCGTVGMTGTSMAAPAVAACAVLARQYYREGYYPSGVANAPDAFTPSGALLKATLLNGAADMTGVPGYPSAREGWGRLLLDDALYFAGDPMTTVIHDVRNAAGLSTAETDEYTISANASSALHVTMVFTDVPAAHAAAFAPVNDLDLEVTGPSGTFRGNVFTGGASVVGGTADNLNNVERVALPAGTFTGGVWTVRVRGAQVPDGPQGYALHVAGEVTEIAGAVGVSRIDAQPNVSAFTLSQNQPNPFGRSTAIRFAVPRRAEVRLAVFDISGRLVRTLSEGAYAPGGYTVEWDGRDESGEEVAGGIYFYRLEGEGVDETRKMVVLR